MFLGWGWCLRLSWLFWLDIVFITMSGVYVCVGFVVISVCVEHFLCFLLFVWGFMLFTYCWMIGLVGVWVFGLIWFLKGCYYVIYYLRLWMSFCVITLALLVLLVGVCGLDLCT